MKTVLLLYGFCGDFMNWIDILAQVIGILGSVFIIGSFQMKSNKWLYVFQSVGGLLFTINFFMIGSYTGSMLNMIGFFRGIILAMGEKWTKKWIGVLVALAYIAAGIVTFIITCKTTMDGVCTVLITISGVATTVSMWTRNGKIIRWVNFGINSPTWLVNNIHYFSLGGIITEVVSIVSVLVSFIRFGLNGFDDEPSKSNKTRSE